MNFFPLPHRTYLFVLCTFLALMRQGLTAHAEGTTNTKATIGQSAPGTGGGTFSSFSRVPVLNANSATVFVGTVTGGTASSGIFLATSTTLSALAVQGQSAPGIAGATFSQLQDPAFNAVGLTAFSAFVTPQNQFNTFSATPGSVNAVVLYGQSAPGTGAGTFTTLNSPNLNNGGGAAFSATVVGGTSTQGIYTALGGSLTTIALQGQSAPGAGAGTLVTLSLPTLNGGGTAAFWSAITGGSSTEGIFTGSGGSLTAVALKGQTAPGGAATFTSFVRSPALSDSGTVVFEATLGGGSLPNGIYNSTAGSLTKIAGVMQSAPGTGGGTFTTFGTSFGVNAGGAAAFEARVTSGASTGGIFKSSGGTLSAIAVQGQIASGSGGSTFVGFFDTNVNVWGTTVFSGNLTAGACIYLGDEQEMIPVVVVGQSLAGSTVSEIYSKFGGDRGGRTGFNDFGQVVYNAVLADTNRGIFLFTPTLHYRNAASGSWDTHTNWTVGLQPGPPHDVVIDPASALVVTGPAAPTTIRSLTINGSGPGVAELDLQSGGTLTLSNGLTIGSSGKLLDSGATLNASGAVVNNGVMTFRGGAVFNASGASSFINNGTLDIITGSVLLPPTFVNNGVVLDSSVVKVKAITKVGVTATLTIDSYTDHTYQLQHSTSPVAASFSNIGSSQTGVTGTTLTFTDPSAPAITGFYRVLVAP